MSLTNSIHFINLRGDLLASITAEEVLLPLALAFGVTSGAGVGEYYLFD
jgi:SulP family sulfate permease